MNEQKQTQQQIDLSQVTEEQLQAALIEKRKEARQQAQQAYKEYDRDKQTFISVSLQKAEYLNKELRDFKAHLIKEANNLYERMYALNDQKPKEVKSFSLKNEEDTMKLVVDRQERFAFTDEAIVYIDAIKGLLKDKFAKYNKGLYNLLDGLLIKNAKNDYDPKLLTKARKQINELGDQKISENFDKLLDCQRVVGSALYCRLYMRNDKSHKWMDVSLNFSSL